MPELKHGFIKGRMNKDFDERLVRNGEYRDALNVEILTSESSDIGSVQNSLGNNRLSQFGSSNHNCIGSITDDKNEKLYWFISGDELTLTLNSDIHTVYYDAIIEYDTSSDLLKPVVTDIFAVQTTSTGGSFTAGTYGDVGTPLPVKSTAGLRPGMQLLAFDPREESLLLTVQSSYIGGPPTIGVNTTVGGNQQVFWVEEVAPTIISIPSDTEVVLSQTITVQGLSLIHI